MKVSLNWMQWYSDVDLKSLPTDELVKLATERLGGIEGVTDLSKQYEGIVVAQVISCEKHPNADKLSLCKIDDGGVTEDVARDENGYVQVVCGAPNVREGLLVAWIPPQSIVPASYGEKELFVLEARDLRGELSNGMLASPAELGMSDDHSGILEIGDEQLAKDNALAMNNEQLSDDHSKLPIAHASQIANGTLSIEIKPGTPLKNLYDLDDIILEIENKMFTHRPDGFGQLGVARELAGIQHKKFVSPDWYLKKISEEQLAKDNALAMNNEQLSDKHRKSLIAHALPMANGKLSIRNEVSELCPRYMAVIIDNVEVKPSPVWLQSYLKRVGIRPINNVVDITNYIMMLTAQPLHAFDFDKVATSTVSHEQLAKDNALAMNNEQLSDDHSKLPIAHASQIANGTSPMTKYADITVRRPKDGEKMTLLDGKEITPHKDAVLICNSDGPIALAGVMGGGNSEVDQNTKTLVLECATFDMYNIRKTSMIHGLFTDAVTRFTKGQPAAQLPAVISKAITMFEELAGAKQVGDIVDVYQKSIINNQKSPCIEVDAKFVNERLGTDFDVQKIASLLQNVEIGVEVNGDSLVITPPFWRTDLEIPEDIVEEVGRLYGFNRLPMTLPQRSIKPVSPEPLQVLKAHLRDSLARAGANEVLGYSFVHGNLLKKVGQNAKHAYALRNALSPDLQYYRLSLLPSLLDRVHPNIKAGYKQFSLFEIGKVHYKNEMDQDEPEIPNEDTHIACVIAYDTKVAPEDSPYYAARRYLAQIAPELVSTLIPMRDFDLTKDEWGQQLTAPYEPTRSGLIIKDNQVWGVVGELKTEVQNAFKLPAYTAGFEVHLDMLSTKEVQYKPLSRFPSTEQDVTLKVSDSIQFTELEECLKSGLQNVEYDWSLTPLGIFQKKDSDTKNVSFRITLTHHQRTLTTDEVTKLVENLSWQAHEQLGAEVV